MNFRIPTLIAVALLFTGCFSASKQGDETETSKLQTSTSASETAVKGSNAQIGRQGSSGDLTMQQVSLQQANGSQSSAEALNRKIIRDANLSLEVSAPADSQHKISSLAEALGGFVVTSETKQVASPDGQSGRDVEVTLVVRVPAAQFSQALDQIRALGTRVISEKVTGQDVTEEFIDLEARVKSQKALESQFLEIMKQANKVVDALEVQRQIAEVRSEIEKLEGRKRFLESRASLSTITISLQTPTSIVVNTSSFGRSIRESVRDAVDIAGAIVLFLIRFVIIMIPIFLLIILPLGLIARAVLRRARRIRESPEAG